MLADAAYSGDILCQKGKEDLELPGSPCSVGLACAHKLHKLGDLGTLAWHPPLPTASCISRANPIYDHSAAPTPDNTFRGTSTKSVTLKVRSTNTCLKDTWGTC